MIEAKDTEIAMLRGELGVSREHFRRLKLRVAGLERRLGSDSTTSGTPPSKDSLEAREGRKAARTGERQSSERELRKDLRRGGQPGHPGAGLSRDPDPDQRRETPPPAECSRCGAGLEAVQHRTGAWWSQVWDVTVTRSVTEYQLPLLTCPCAARRPPRRPRPGRLRAASPTGRDHTAAVLLASDGNVPAERAANLIGMLLGVPVSPGVTRGAGRAGPAGANGSLLSCKTADSSRSNSVKALRSTPSSHGSGRARR